MPIAADDSRNQKDQAMPRLHLHPERHLVSRIGWLRAAVLGANDGIVSTASLIVGVAAAAATQSDILIAGVAGCICNFSFASLSTRMCRFSAMHFFSARVKCVLSAP